MPAAGGKANIYDIQPQMWAYERTAEGGTQPYRAFVSIPGHLWSTFEKPHYRARSCCAGSPRRGSARILMSSVSRRRFPRLRIPRAGRRSRSRRWRIWRCIPTSR